MDIFFVFLVFSAPLLTVSIISFLQQKDRRKNWLNGAVYVLNIFFSSIGPLVISILLLRKSALSTLMAAVTMAGFIPSAVSLLLWFVLSKRSPKLMSGINAVVFTLLNIGWPFLLTILNQSDTCYVFFEIFSYEFLAMAIGASAGITFSPMMKVLDKRHILLVIIFLTAVLLGPGIYYEYQWLVLGTAVHSSGFMLTGIGMLIFRYFGIAGLSLFVFNNLKKIT